MSITTKNYIGYEALVSYLSESRNCSYKRFLNLNRDTIIASLTSLTNSPLTSVKWQTFNITWYKRFLTEAKEILEPNTFAELKIKINAEYSCYTNKLQTFWEGVIKEYEKENLESATATVTSLPNQTQSIHIEDYSKILQSDSLRENLESTTTADTSFSNQIQNTYIKDHSKPFLSKKNIKLINFCYDILYEFENMAYAQAFFEYVEKDATNKIASHPMDFFTINSKLENNEYTILEEFEEDIRLIFRNCYIYNDVKSEIYCLGETLESLFNKKWNEKLILQDRQTRKLKRARDNDDDNDTNYNSFKKQIQFLEQNKDKLVYRQVINNGLLIASAYESLIVGDIIPFIKNLKTFLLTRSQMSLFSANEPVLQAIVESLLPLKYFIPELSLIMDGKKRKGSGRFGYSDIFVLNETGDNNTISLELKYISLVGLIKNQKIKFGANDLENLDEILEKEDEGVLLKRIYLN
ncbi:hypothetical protein RclHR1_06110009 [Rhizophagus clarus]|uniref:Bromodomain-containing protein n=1 Tax=Rhizophagus clarus TaxID=94130 RepID=A0A2Z6S2Y8_9GLOM|nr:hypothetical protein RclHR1_06110009 [Rhizophagus clarus]GES90120.1 bromodomain-containing protein [Rhizophagus clarus]